MVESLLALKSRLDEVLASSFGKADAFAAALKVGLSDLWPTSMACLQATCMFIVMHRSSSQQI